jgi:hypothetical protein
VVLLAVRRRARRQGADALLVALLSLVAISLSACGESAGSEDASSNAGDITERGAAPEAASGDCGGAGEDFVLGMSKITPSGALTVAIVAAEPAPPLKGLNSWTVQLSDESGEAVSAASLSFSGWMPLHRHGLNSLPVIRELDGGRYEIQPIVLYMPQLWELSVLVTRNDETEDVTFDICVP